MSINGWRWWAVRAFVAASVATMVGSCAGKRAPMPVPEDAHAGELVNRESCPYERDDVQVAADCGMLVVPENRSEPDSRLIVLPVVRLHALAGGSAEPIFWLAGGPGASNLQFPGMKGLIEHHDIVMVGYRGVDGSVVLACPEMALAARGVGDDLLSRASTANFGDAMTRCAERLTATGIDLDGYSIPEVVEDMEDARDALGYEHVNLLSGSYGTRVAMIYAWMHPESLHRSAMISANPPWHFVWEPDVIDTQIAYDAGLCRKDAECSARTDDLAETMRSVAHHLPKRWLLIPIDPGKVKFVTQFMLFQRGTAAIVFDAYLAAEEGDPSGLALMSVAANFVIPSIAIWGDWAAKGSIDYNPERDWMTEMNPPNSILGSPISLLVGTASQVGGGWPTAPTPDAFHVAQPSDVETLVVSGSIDYSTPARFATEELLPALSHGRQVILSEFGHFGDVWGLQPEARRHLLATFFDTGEVDDSHFKYQPMVFHVALGFPGMAKIAVVVVILVIGGLLLAWQLILRMVRRHRAAKVPVPPQRMEDAGPA